MNGEPIPGAVPKVVVEVAAPSPAPKPDQAPLTGDNFSGPWRDSTAQAPATPDGSLERAYADLNKPAAAGGETPAQPPTGEGPLERAYKDITSGVEVSQPQASSGGDTLTRTYNDLDSLAPASLKLSPEEVARRDAAEAAGKDMVGVNQAEEAVVEAARTGDPRDFIAKVQAMPAGTLTPDFTEWLSKRFTGVEAALRPEAAMSNRLPGQESSDVTFASITEAIEKLHPEITEDIKLREAVVDLEMAALRIAIFTKNTDAILFANDQLRIDMIDAFKKQGGDLSIRALDQRTIVEFGRKIFEKLGVRLPGVDDLTMTEEGRAALEQADREQALRHTISADPAVEPGPTLVTEPIPTPTPTQAPSA